MSTTKHTAKKLIQEQLLSQEQWDSEWLLVSIVYAAFLKEGLPRNSSKGQEEALDNGRWLSAILYNSFILLSHSLKLEVKFYDYYIKRASTGHG